MLRKPTNAFVYLLGGYVVVQFIWWGYHLIELTRSSQMAEPLINKRVFMIVGEGSVFLLLLLFGLWKIKTSMRKEITLARRQQNFILSVTHELKTPIAANKLYLQTMLRHALSEEKRTELLNKAIDEANRLEMLVEQLLTAAQLEQRAVTLKPESVDIVHFIKDLTELHEKRSHIPISFKAPDDFTTKVDPLLLSTIINNLLDNAVKYAPTEKGIEVSVQKLNISNWVIQIKDFGSGIPIDQKDLLFQKFVRLENEETRTNKGTGLGLYIAKEFTKALGGQLKLTTYAPEGACFEIHLTHE